MFGVFNKETGKWITWIEEHNVEKLAPDKFLLKDVGPVDTNFVWEGTYEEGEVRNPKDGLFGRDVAVYERNEIADKQTMLKKADAKLEKQVEELLIMVDRIAKQIGIHDEGFTKLVNNVKAINKVFVDRRKRIEDSEHADYVPVKDEQSFIDHKLIKMVQ